MGEVTGKWKSARREHKAERGLTSRSRHRFKIEREAQLLILPSMNGLRDCDSEEKKRKKRITAGIPPHRRPIRAM